jgi:hypothetical protein
MSEPVAHGPLSQKISKILISGLPVVKWTPAAGSGVWEGNAVLPWKFDARKRVPGEKYRRK